jgi:hypothetical protein
VFTKSPYPLHSILNQIQPVLSHRGCLRFGLTLVCLPACAYIYHTDCSFAVFWPKWGSNILFFILNGTTGQCGPTSAVLRPYRNRIYRNLIGFLGRGIGPSQKLYLHRTTQTQTYIHATSGIRTPNPNVRAAEYVIDEHIKMSSSSSSSSSFDGLGSLACFQSESVWNYVSYRWLVGLLVQWISTTQGSQNKLRRPYLEWDSNPRSKCSCERRHFVPCTARHVKYQC